MNEIINKNIIEKFTEDRVPISQLAWFFDLSPLRILEKLSYELDYSQIRVLDKANEELRYGNILINRNNNGI